MTYLLDTMIVSYFLQAAREKELTVAAGACPMVLVDEVRQELENDPNRGGNAFKKWLATSGIVVRAVVIGTPAHATLAHLISPAVPAKNLGERASIALASSDPSLTFVTHDKNGVWIALREIWSPGERILGVPVFLRRLYEQGAIKNLDVIDDVVALVQAVQLPSWWATWRSTVSALAANARRNLEGDVAQLRARLREDDRTDKSDSVTWPHLPSHLKRLPARATVVQPAGSRRAQGSFPEVVRFAAVSRAFGL